MVLANGPRFFDRYAAETESGFVPHTELATAAAAAPSKSGRVTGFSEPRLQGAVVPEGR
jgi:hypothetical protein